MMEKEQLQNEIKFAKQRLKDTRRKINLGVINPNTIPDSDFKTMLGTRTYLETKIETLEHVRDWERHLVIDLSSGVSK